MYIMRKSSGYKSLFVAFAMMVFAGCHNNVFDFSQLDNIDMEGDWGLPLLNAEYTIGDILTLADNPGLIYQNSDGTLELRYVYSFDSLISASEYLDSYINKNISVGGTKTFSSAGLPPSSGNIQILYKDTLTAELPDDKVVLESATLKKGQVKIQVSYNLTQPTTLIVTCPQLKNAAGESFNVSETATGGSYSKTFNISGYTLTCNSDQKVDFYLEVKSSTNGGSLPEELTFTYNASFSQLSFSEIRGKFATVDLALDKEWNFNSEFLRQHIMGTMTIMNPQVTCEVMNTFPVDGNIALQEATLYGNGLSGSLLANTPATVYIPGSTEDFTPISLPLPSSLLLSADYDHFKLKGNASFNPNGLNAPSMVFRDDQLISLRLTVVLPLEMSTDNVLFKDTIIFGGISLPSEMSFSNFFLRMAVHNGLPVNFQMQAYFYDSQTNTIKDSLFNDARTVLSAQGDVPRMTELFATKENYSDVTNMLACDKIILSGKFSTDGQPVSINVNQSLRVQLSARFNMDINGLVNLGN